MRDVNHCLTKALVSEYGAGTLFVVEDLADIIFAEGNQRDAKGNRELHSWASISTSNSSATRRSWPELRC